MSFETELQENKDGRRIRAYTHLGNPTPPKLQKDTYKDGDDPQTIIPEEFAKEAYDGGLDIVYFPPDETEDIDGGALAAYVHTAVYYHIAAMEADPGEVEVLADALEEEYEEFGIHEPSKTGRHAVGIVADWEDINLSDYDIDRKGSAANIGSEELLGIEGSQDKMKPRDEVEVPGHGELYINVLEETARGVVNSSSEETVTMQVPNSKIVPHAFQDVVQILEESGHETRDLTIAGSRAKARLDKIPADILIHTKGDEYDVSTAEGFELYEPSEEEDKEEDEGSGFMERLGINW